MADELDMVLNEPSEAEKRIKQLSNKVKEEAELREKLAQEKAELEKKAAELEKKTKFLDEFSSLVSENPSLKEHKAEIEQKVSSGMSLEDATYIVLGKAGKLEKETPAGGSAVTNPTPTPQHELKGEELYKFLVEAEKRGDIALT